MSKIPILKLENNSTRFIRMFFLKVMHLRYYKCLLGKRPPRPKMFQRLEILQFTELFKEQTDASAY